jgi:hypothetical protein
LPPTVTEQLIQNQLLERKTRRNYYCELIRTVIRIWSECSVENWFPFNCKGLPTYRCHVLRYQGTLVTTI